MLTERQILILTTIIRLYTDYGNAVGSKTLMNEAGLNYSSATIRNEMGRLEELGFIQKTHSSSGRIPSIKGYRFYVDHLVHPDKVTSKDIAIIKSSFGNEFHELDEIVAESAEVLSQLTSYTAITLGPELKDSRLTGFRLVPLSDFQVMVILVTDKGHVENQIFNLPKSINGYELEKIVRIFNDQLVGYPLVEVYQKLKNDIPQLLQKYVRTPIGIIDVVDNIITRAAQDRFFVRGRMNILDFNEAMDVEKFKSIYNLMDGNTSLTSLINQSHEGIEVKIGQELQNELFQDFSLITASYDVVGHGSGMIALLGPTSMPYSKMIGLVDVFRNELSQKMIEYYRSMED